MSKLPGVSGKEAIKVFEKLGFRNVRQKGGHIVMRKGNCGCIIPLEFPVSPGWERNKNRFGGLICMTECYAVREESLTDRFILIIGTIMFCLDGGQSGTTDRVDVYVWDAVKGG